MRVLYRPLWEGMQISLRDIFIQGYLADKVIQRQLKANRKWGSHDRKLFAEAVYDIVRWWRRLLFACEIPWPESDVWTEDSAEIFQKVIAAWCLLHEVELDKKISVARLNNSALESIWNSHDLPPAVLDSLPDWLESWGSEQLGERWRHTMAALNTEAPVYLRANGIKTNSSELSEALRREKIDVQIINSECVKLEKRSNVFLTQAFRQGLFEVQDIHSQAVGLRLSPEPGLRVVDACAGAGGKSLHLASLMKNKGKIISLDVVQEKLAQLRLRATRGGASCIETRWIENTKTIKRLADGAEAVLLDVPCSGLGVLRRNPDAKWRLSRPEVDRLRGIQAEILGSYPSMCKAGGKLVYATCSVMPSENADQVDLFIGKHGSNWKVLQTETLWPTVGGGDGFFIASFQRL
jgi:16S rRNA (cytosine967-C5)-methyltransferase